MTTHEEFKQRIEKKISVLLSRLEELKGEIEFNNEEGERLYNKSLNELKQKQGELFMQLDNLEKPGEISEEAIDLVENKFDDFLKLYQEFAKKFR